MEERYKLIGMLRCDELRVIGNKEHYEGKGRELIEKKCPY
jgi:hypothetical protein